MTNYTNLQIMSSREINIISMKKLILMIFISLITKVTSAQLFNTTLFVLPRPNATLTDWDRKTLTYVVSGAAGVQMTVLIKTEIKKLDGTAVATINLNKAHKVLAGTTNLVLTVDDVLPLDAMIFNGTFKNSLDRSGKLPADDYMICVQLLEPGSFSPVSDVKCRNFNVASFQLPIPVLPANDEVIEAEKAQTAITFRWTPVSPTPPQPVKYIVTVFEVLDKQNPMQALRGNQPLLTKEIIGTTQFIWQPQLSFIKTRIWDKDSSRNKNEMNDEWKSRMDSIDATRFIWTIQTVDLAGHPFGDGNVNGDGISEPNVFTVIKDTRKVKTGPPSRTIYMNRISMEKH